MHVLKFKIKKLILDDILEINLDSEIDNAELIHIKEEMKVKIIELK